MELDGILNFRKVIEYVADNRKTYPGVLTIIVDALAKARSEIGTRINTFLGTDSIWIVQLQHAYAYQLLISGSEDQPADLTPPTDERSLQIIAMANEMALEIAQRILASLPPELTSAALQAHLDEQHS